RHDASNAAGVRRAARSSVRRLSSAPRHGSGRRNVDAPPRTGVGQSAATLRRDPRRRDGTRAAQRQTRDLSLVPQLFEAMVAALPPGPAQDTATSPKTRRKLPPVTFATSSRE